MNFAKPLSLLVLGAAATLLQGSCQTSTWTTYHTPLQGQNDTATATLYEHMINITPPNPPLTWDYTVEVIEVPLEEKAMSPMFVQMPDGPYYVSHEVSFGPHLPDRSALTFARYMHATMVEMVSDLPTGQSVTSESTPPGDWQYCTP